MPDGKGDQLELRDEGASGYRHYLNDQAVHAGSFLQVLTEDGWVDGRYEWSFMVLAKPYLVIGDGQTVVLDDDAWLRWPVT